MQALRHWIRYQPALASCRSSCCRLGTQHRLVRTSNAKWIDWVPCVPACMVRRPQSKVYYVLSRCSTLFLSAGMGSTRNCPKKRTRIYYCDVRYCVRRPVCCPSLHLTAFPWRSWRCGLPQTVQGGGTLEHDRDTWRRMLLVRIRTGKRRCSVSGRRRRSFLRFAAAKMSRLPFVLAWRMRSSAVSPAGRRACSVNLPTMSGFCQGALAERRPCSPRRPPAFRTPRSGGATSAPRDRSSSARTAAPACAASSSRRSLGRAS
mmetsp:Transcript_90757/g.292945  ORF Transcript_90757/g.292945 Transcript_90757/m.292945 type:complete len:261 (-) Transcript_90757:847-1629(-)